jgi:hypothetical protein
MGLNTLADSVVTEQVVCERNGWEVDWTYATPSLEGVVCLIDTRTQT